MVENKRGMRRKVQPVSSAGLSPAVLAALDAVIENNRRARRIGRAGKSRSVTPGSMVLFAGLTGTGKTLAAEMLARELGLDLYRIDLSAVVSKYIGETEKNLAHVFDKAEGSGAVLLIDEADALFGRRSEVKDAHDRYANAAINYLVRRIETYHGPVILATNHPDKIHPAFARRRRHIVTLPDSEGRFRGRE